MLLCKLYQLYKSERRQHCIGDLAVLNPKCFWFSTYKLWSFSGKDEGEALSTCFLVFPQCNAIPQDYWEDSFMHGCIQLSTFNSYLKHSVSVTLLALGIHESSQSSGEKNIQYFSIYFSLLASKKLSSTFSPNLYFSLYEILIPKYIVYIFMSVCIVVLYNKRSKIIFNPPFPRVTFCPLGEIFPPVKDQGVIGECGKCNRVRGTSY